MSQLREILTRQLAEHPIDFGMSDATAILEFLYTAYCESRESDPPETKSLFARWANIWRHFLWTQTM